MFRKIILTIGLLAVWTLLVSAFVLVEAMWFAEPSVVRGDIASIRDHLDSRLDKAAAEGTLGAALLAVIQDGQIVFERGYGAANVETGAPVDAERSLFQVGSVSKMVTAVGVMKLVQDGLLTLDEPVTGRLRRWHFDGSDERRERITVRHLLSHTAGVDDPSGYVGFLAEERAATLEDYLNGVRVSREPGTVFAYGNASSAILQLLIEDVTGQPFAEYMFEEVLSPLGMTSSTFDLDLARSRLAPAFDAGLVAQSPRRHSIPSAVALYTSGRDLARFAMALSGANSVLNDHSIRLMMQPSVSTGGGWGLGLTLFVPNEKGGFVVGHDGGAIPAWGGMVRYNPATRNGLVVTISGGRGVANQLSHDWVYWETGQLTSEGRRQTAYGRFRPAAWAIGIGSALIILMSAFLTWKGRQPHG